MSEETKENDVVIAPFSSVMCERPFRKEGTFWVKGSFTNYSYAKQDGGTVLWLIKQEEFVVTQRKHIFTMRQNEIKKVLTNA